MTSTRLLRERQAQARTALDRIGTIAEEGSLSTLAQTVTFKTYPTSPSSYFACQPLLVDGAESEGASAAFTSDSARTFYAYNVGLQIPPVGTRIIVTCCGGRWIFRFDG